MSSHEPAIAVPLVAGATQVLQSAGRGRYRGITVRETAGGALTLQLFDNAAAASGTIIDTIVVPANGVVSYFFESGVFLANGLFLNRVAGGAFEGSVRLG